MPKPWEHWTDADDAELQRLIDQGRTTQQMASALNRSSDGVRNRIRRLGLTPGGAPKTPPSNAALDAITAEYDQIPAWLEALRPVALPAPAPPVAMSSANDFTLVAGDFHFPQHCPDTIAVLLATVKALKPNRIILNGDTVDLLAVSRYPKDQRHTYDLRQEVVAFHEFLHQLVSLTNAWGTEIIETEANHSGNGTASRWHRYLSDRVPVLYGHPKAQELLDYQTWFYPDWAPIRLVESVVIADDLLVLHGDLVRKHAAYSARGHSEKWHSSVMHSHTHRMGSSLERIPAVGNRPEAVRRAYEIGCVCNLQPSYVSAPNWTNGFAIIAHNDEEYGVELVNVSRGQAVVAALGQTIRAGD